MAAGDTTVGSTPSPRSVISPAHGRSKLEVHEPAVRLYLLRFA